MTDRSTLIGGLIKDLRTQKGLVLKDVAALSGLSVSYLSDIERGSTLPSLMTLDRLAKAFDTLLTISFALPTDIPASVSLLEMDVLMTLRDKDYARLLYLIATLMAVDGKP